METLTPTLSETKVRSGFLPDRIIQLHPTRLCNLACLHCYSESGPQHRAALDVGAVWRALPLLRAEGYGQISISGGEPLMYVPLPELIDGARESGFRVTMISNGMFPAKRMIEAATRLDGMAISFDGPAAIHNRLRGKPDAFERASATLARLAEAGLPVGAAVSVSREAIPELPELADHLVGLGAQAIQLRPIALAGRARELKEVTVPGDLDRSRLYLVALALREEFAGRARVHCDLAPARSLWAQRGAYAGLLAECAEGCEVGLGDRTLSDLVNPLIVTEAGELKPIAFDFNERYRVGMLESIAEELGAYKRDRAGELRAFVGRALGRMEGAEGLVDWFDFCARLSNVGGKYLEVGRRWTT